MAIRKIKIVGSILELPAKQHYLFSPLGPFSRLMSWIGSFVLKARTLPVIGKRYMLSCKTLVISSVA
jgi:hypothetical protein